MKPDHSLFTLKNFGLFRSNIAILIDTIKSNLKNEENGIDVMDNVSIFTMKTISGKYVYLIVIFSFLIILEENKIHSFKLYLLLYHCN